jgi:plastocyanin
MRRYALAVVLLGTLLVALPAFASSETSSTVTAENIGGFYGEEHRWTPSPVTVSTVGGVTLSNPTEIRHGVRWITAPAPPNCDSGVPVGVSETASGTKWSGTCKFTQAGTYTYYCTVHGAAMSGTITVRDPGAPSAATGAPSEVTQTSASLVGTVKPEGNETSYYFKYGPVGGAEQTLPLSPEGVRPDFAEHSVSVALSALKASTEYHARLVAIYSAANTEVPGNVQTFTTPAPAPPAVTTLRAAGLKETEATLEGAVDPNDGAMTEYFFEYGAGVGYGQTTPVTSLPADNIRRTVSAKAPELAPGKTYHFRLVAKNEAGPAEGVDREFTTPSAPASPPPPSGSPPPSEPPSTPPSPPPAAPPGLTPSLPTPPLDPRGLPVFDAPLLAGSQTITAPRHGSSVRVSLEITQMGAGGRLEIDLLTKKASLAKASGSGSKLVVVGRMVRQSVSAGRQTLSVALTAQGKRALTRRHSLPLSVKIALTPIQGAAVTVTRGVTLHSR